MAASLGESEKARYPLTFLRRKDLVRPLLGDAPQSDRYLIANWGIPFVTGDYWFIPPSPPAACGASRVSATFSTSPLTPKKSGASSPPASPMRGPSTLP